MRAKPASYPGSMRTLPIHPELTPEERDEWIEKIAREVVRRRLEVPAILALEMHRPLSFLASQALVVFTPMLAPALGLEALQRLSRLMEDRENLDRLVDRIEELSRERTNGPPPGDAASAPPESPGPATP